MELEFTPIQLDRQPEYRHRLATCPEVSSDYSFVNLWGWAPEHGLEWAWDEHLVWIRQTRGEFQAFWAPIGPWDAVDWNRNVSLLSAGHRFCRVPERLTQIWKEAPVAAHRIEEQRDHWDYLYSVEELAALRGNRFHKKKNLVNQFTRKFDSTYLPFSEDMIERAREMQSDWCLWRDCEASDTLSAENRAIERTLNHWDRLEALSGGALLVEGELVAYTIAEPLTDDIILIHYEKANAEYKGAYQAINRMFLETVAGEFGSVNREQDLGDDGLRKAKQSYHPTGYIKKYDIHF
jgi:hypothetical protein